jgi:hypothetical protein
MTTLQKRALSQALNGLEDARKATYDFHFPYELTEILNKPENKILKMKVMDQFKLTCGHISLAEGWINAIRDEVQP